MKQLTELISEEIFSIRKNFDDQEVYDFAAQNIKLNISLPKLNPKILTQIFTHKSFSHEHGERYAHNEKLEFLGDAVLDLLVTNILLKNYPKLSEGELSKFRSSLVNEKSLFDFARILNMGANILLGNGELKSLGHQKSSILADTFEAMLGGIYLELGLQATEDFFDLALKYYEQHTGESFFDHNNAANFDAKTKLQELVMKKYKVNPKYECESLDTSGEFKISFMINDEVIATDIFSSKKKGMQQLAHKILNDNLIKLDSESLC